MTSIQRRALLAVIIGSAVAFLDTSVVNLALPRITSELHGGFAGQQWVIDGYALTLGALMLLGGSVGDIAGRRRVYLWGVAGFMLMSFVCAVAPSIEVLIAGRILQGVFGALMIPGALAIINTNFSADQRGRAIGLWTAATSGVMAAGPLLGGYLIDTTSWRWIFLINAPLLLAVLWLGLTSIKETHERARRVDWTGALLAIMMLGGLIYGLIEGPPNHWPPVTQASLLVGALGVGLFIWHEHRHKDPLLPLRLFKSRNFTGTNIVTFAMYGGLGGFFFIFTIYLQTTLHYSALAAGLTSLPVAVFLTALSGKVGALSDKYGPRWFMTFGPLLAGLGMLSLLPLHDGSSYVWHILPSILLFALGMALTVAPLTTTAIASVGKESSGIASAVNNAVSRVAGLLVVAVLGLLGAGQAFQFAAILCGSMAISAGVLSAVLIRNATPSSQ